MDPKALYANMTEALDITENDLAISRGVDVLCDALFEINPAFEPAIELLRARQASPGGT